MTDLAERSNGARRATCVRCQRPCRVCLCSVLPSEPIHTETSVIIIQTPAERRANVKTADLVPLCLSNSRIVSSTKHAEAAIPTDAVLLFPSDDSLSLDEISTQPHTLVLLDSTWDKARRVLTRSSFLQSLRRVSIPERYLGSPIFKARKSPTHAVKCARSTAEATAAALECLEGDDASDAISAIRRTVVEASEAQLRFIRKKGPDAGRHRTNRSGYQPGLYSKRPGQTLPPMTSREVIAQSSSNAKADLF